LLDRSGLASEEDKCCKEEASASDDHEDDGAAISSLSSGRSGGGVIEALRAALRVDRWWGEECCGCGKSEKNAA
jgi:hypothetical protein